MTDGRLVEARVHYGCGCETHHPMIFEKHLALYVHECHIHGDHTGPRTNPGRRVRVEKLRLITPEEERRALAADAFARGSVSDAQMEDQHVSGPMHGAGEPDGG